MEDYLRTSAGCAPSRTTSPYIALGNSSPDLAIRITVSVCDSMRARVLTARHSEGDPDECSGRDPRTTVGHPSANR